MNRKALIEQAKIIEEATYYPSGEWVDGAIYTCIGRLSWDFMHTVKAYLGNGDYQEGNKIVRARVQERKNAGENLADPDCGNWQLWVIFNELGVSRFQR